MARGAELDDSPFGVNSHEQSEYITRLARESLRWHRVDFKWSRIATTPRQEDWDWSAPDNMAKAAEEAGASLLVVVAYTPRWASRQQDQAGLSEQGKDALPPVDPQGYLEFVETLVRRFAGRIQAIALWNEPNLKEFWGGNRERYMAMIIPALQRVREIAPDLPIAGPDLNTWSDKGSEDWMKDLVQRKVPQTFYDVISHHQYGADSDDSVKSRLGRIDDLHKYLSNVGLGDKAFWITETGWDFPKFTRERQVQSLKDALQAMKQRSAWWKKTFWYDSHGKGFGLIGNPEDPDPGAIRPALNAYAEVIRDAGITTPTGLARAREIVRLLYTVVLRRSPAEIDQDPKGFENNVRQLQRTSAESVCQSFLVSGEFSSRWESMTPDDIAQEMVSKIPGADTDTSFVAALAADIQARKSPRLATMIASSLTA